MLTHFRPLADAAPADAHAVTVWHCPEDASLACHLTPGEQARAARLRTEAARLQFVSSRGALRAVLGRLLGVSPVEVEIAIGPDGKPHLAGREFEFNLSHTAGLALVATGPVPVGVDVERVRVVASAEGLVRRYFGARERAEFAALPAELRPAAFLRGWTHKEAVLKGIGCGTRDLDRCEVRLDPRTPPAIVAPPETVATWELSEWRPDAGTVAALAVSRS